MEYIFMPEWAFEEQNKLADQHEQEKSKERLDEYILSHASPALLEEYEREKKEFDGRFMFVVPDFNHTHSEMADMLEEQRRLREAYERGEIEDDMSAECRKNWIEKCNS